MSRSAKDKQSSGRRQNDENEPFLVEEIPASPRIRGRRQISQEDPFVIENIPRSPVARGRRINFEEESLLVRDMSGSPVMRGRGSRITTNGRSTSDAVESPNDDSISTSNPDIIAGSATIPTAPTIPDVENTRRNEPPAHEDAPPSYESSIPPSHIGWAMNVTNQVPFPLPYSNDTNDVKPSLDSRAKCPYPLTDLSPLPKSYLSLDRPSSRSSRPSPSRSPSPYTPKPSYTPHTSAAYYARHGGKPPRRPQYRSERDERSELERSNSNDQSSHRQGGILSAIVFIMFMVVLALLVTFLWRRKASSRYHSP